MANAEAVRLVEGLRWELGRQAAVADLYERYYFGEMVPAFASAEWTRVFGEQFEQLTSNWCQLVVDAAAERLEVKGFTFPSLAKDNETAGADGMSLELWEFNQLGSRQSLAHTTAVYSGRSFALVEKPEREGEPARISVEHPTQVFVRRDAYGRPVEAIKIFRDLTPMGDEGDEQITVWTRDWTYRLTKRLEKRDGKWVLGDPVDRAVEERNELGVPLVIPLDNRPVLDAAGPVQVGRKLMLGAMGDLHTIPAVQSAIDKTLADWMVSGEFSSYPQRWGVGVEPPTDPRTNQPLPSDQWQVGRDRLLLAKNDNARFGEFSVDDGTAMQKRVETLVQHIAAQTRTPPHYLLGSIINTSGDALKAAEAGLVQRIRAKHRPLGSGWEQATRVACGLMGDMQRFKDRRCTAVWADPEVRTEGERVDAAIKLYQSGLLPLTMVLERLDYDPQQVQRAVQLLGMPKRDDPARPSPPAKAGALEDVVPAAA